MSRVAKNPFPFVDTVAPQIEKARAAKHTSLNRLSKDAGVSRRHLAELQKGANVTLLLARAVMTALDIDELDIGGGYRLVLARDQNRTALTTVADDLERAGALILRSAATMREMLHESLSHSSNEAGSADHAARAANLIEEFSAMVRNSTSDEQVDQLQRLVHASSSILTPPAPRRRRKANTA